METFKENLLEKISVQIRGNLISEFGEETIVENNKNIFGREIVGEKKVQVFFENIQFGKVVVSVFYKLEGDRQDEFVFEAMTTLPEDARGNKYGSSVIKNILETLKKYLRNKNLKSVKAVQVQRYSESFWGSEELRFEKCLPLIRQTILNIK